MGSIASPVAVFLSSCIFVVRALFTAANQADFEDNRLSWCACHSMSWLDASFPIHVAMVSRHERTIYKTRRVCSLCPVMVSLSGCDVMTSPSFMAAVKRNGVGWKLLSSFDLLCTCANLRQRRTVLVQTNSPVFGSTVVLMLMEVSTLVRVFEASPRRSSVSRREESSGLSSRPLMGG